MTAVSTPSTRTSRAADAIPGPRGLPLLGVLPQLWRDPLDCLSNAARKYGGVVALPVGTTRFYLVSHPEDVRLVLQERHQHYVKAPQYRRAKAIFGNGLITSEGAFWRRQRHLTQPAFQRKRHEFFGTVMTAATNAVIDRWAAVAARGGTINLTHEMIELAKDVLFKAMFGGTISDADGMLTRALNAVQRSVNPVAMVDPFQIISRLPTPANRDTRAAVRELNAFVYRLIDQRRRHPTGDDDFLSLLLSVGDEAGGGMSDEQLRDEIVTILQAGHEPVANTLIWTFYLISHAPLVQEKLRAEAATVIGERAPISDDVPHLAFTMMVIHEALRLYPPGWVLARSPIQDEEIGGYQVPAHSVVALSPYVTHRLPSFWEEPETFDPERFRPERWAGRPRFAYFPFGGGPRLCAGESFALTEMPLVVAMVARAYRLALVPGQRVVPRPLITLVPPAQMMMTPHRV